MSKQKSKKIIFKETVVVGVSNSPLLGGGVEKMMLLFGERGN